MERLQSILQLLTRPIEFASRDAYAHLSTVKDLGPFVSRQVVQALAETVYPARVETDLLALRQLFTDYDQVRDLAERKRRLAGARAILDRLSHARERAESLAATAPPAALWNIPIQYAKGSGRSGRPCSRSSACGPWTRPCGFCRGVTKTGR